MHDKYHSVRHDIKQIITSLHIKYLVYWHNPSLQGLHSNFNVQKDAKKHFFKHRLEESAETEIMINPSEQVIGRRLHMQFKIDRY